MHKGSQTLDVFGFLCICWQGSKAKFFPTSCSLWGYSSRSKKSKSPTSRELKIRGRGPSSFQSLLETQLIPTNLILWELLPPGNRLVSIKQQKVNKIYIHCPSRSIPCLFVHCFLVHFLSYNNILILRYVSLIERILPIIL